MDEKRKKLSSLKQFEVVDWRLTQSRQGRKEKVKKKAMFPAKAVLGNVIRGPSPQAARDDTRGRLCLGATWWAGGKLGATGSRQFRAERAVAHAKPPGAQRKGKKEAMFPAKAVLGNVIRGPSPQAARDDTRGRLCLGATWWAGGKLGATGWAGASSGRRFGPFPSFFQT